MENTKKETLDLLQWITDWMQNYTNIKNWNNLWIAVQWVLINKWLERVWDGLDNIADAIDNLAESMKVKEVITANNSKTKTFGTITTDYITIAMDLYKIIIKIYHACF